MTSKTVTKCHDHTTSKNTNSNQSSAFIPPKAEVSTSASVLSSSQSNPIYDTPIFATRHWANILLYIENLVVKISTIMVLLTRHLAIPKGLAHYAV